MILEHLRNNQPANCEICGVRIYVDVNLDGFNATIPTSEEDFREIAKVLTPQEIEQLQLRCVLHSTLEEQELMARAWYLLILDIERMAIEDTACIVDALLRNLNLN